MTESPAIKSAKNSSNLAEVSIRVLSVDDDSGFLKIMKKILEARDAFQVDTASSADEAMGKMKKTTYDAVVSDYQMPGKDGLDFLKELRAEGNDVSFILFTGKGRESIAIQALNQGADRYFNKMGDPETVYGELAHGIRQAVEKKRAEVIIQRQNEFLENTLESLTYPFYVIDAADYTIQLANSATGFDASVKGLTCYELTHKRGIPCADEHVCPLEEVKKTKKPVIVEHLHHDEDGHVVNVEVHGYPIFDDGNVVQIIEYTLDITERKKAEKSLEESEEDYRRIVELAPDGIITANRRGVITSVNPSFLRLTGFSEEEIVGKHFTKIGTIKAREIPRYIKLFTSSLRGKTIPPIEFEYIKKDGTQGWGEAHSSVLKKDGRTVGFQAILRDITDSKESLEKIKASEERFRRLVELAPDGIVSLDVNGVITSRNTAASRISGYSKGELIGKHFLNLGKIPAKDLSRLTELFTSIMKGKETTPFEVNLLRKDGSSYFVEVSIGVQKENGKTVGLQVIFRDVTERKRAEEELIRLSTAVKMSSDSIVISDLEGKIVYVNDATLKMYDAANSQDLIGKSSFDFVVPEDREKAVASAREAIEKGYIEGQEYDIVTKNGSRIPVEINASVMKDADGKPMGFVGISRDITESKTREEEMKRRLMKFRLDVGKLYLVKESSTTLSLEAFKDLLNVGYRGLVFSRTPEENFKKNVDGSFEFRWLAERGGEKSLSPKFEKIEKIIEKTLKKSVVLLDCLDYLVLKNGFKETLFFVQRLREHSYLKGNVVILSVDPTTLSAREIRLLEKEGREVEPQVLVRLPEDLLEILRFIYEHNALGAKPNYTDVRQELSISKPTVGKRIKVLVNTGYVTENVRGRSKVLELTYKGMRLFLR